MKHFVLAAAFILAASTASATANAQSFGNFGDLFSRVAAIETAFGNTNGSPVSVFAAQGQGTQVFGDASPINMPDLAPLQNSLGQATRRFGAIEFGDNGGSFNFADAVNNIASQEGAVVETAGNVNLGNFQNSFNDISSRFGGFFR